MAISDSLSRVAASLLALVRNRLELAAVEFEEETLRLYTFLLRSLVSLIFLGIAISLLVVLVLVLFWDTHRVAVLLVLIAITGFLGLRIGLNAYAAYQHKPPLLNATLNELQKDMETLRAASKDQPESK